jgi:hypothetical protein
MPQVDITRASAATVFARIFDVDRESAKIFEKDFAVQSTVPARPAGGDENFARGVGPVCEFRSDFGLQRLTGKIKIESALERLWLLVDFAQHGVRKGGVRGVGHGIRSGGTKPA